MNIRIFKKAIFFFFAFVNLSIPIKALTFKPVDTSKTFQNNKIKWNKLNTNFNRLESNNILENSINRNAYEANNVSKESQSFTSKDDDNYKNELEILSERQSEQNNILYADGNVLVIYKGNTLSADSVIYDKNKESIRAEGNISLFLGKQIVKADSLEYDFINKKGFLKEVKGLISTNNLIDDLYSKFKTNDTKTKIVLEEIQKNTVLNTPDVVNNWAFFTDEIEINDEIWKTKKAIFTNDLLELNQVKLVINSLRIISSREQLRFKSSVNYLILDEKFSIPFLLGNRTLNKSGEKLILENNWNMGLDNKDKDGYFIGRAMNPITFSDKFFLELEPQLFVQRWLKGSTKSFVKKGESITSKKERQDTTFSDYFGMNSKIRGELGSWDLSVMKEINSFDLGKTIEALRVKGELSRKIDFLNSEWKNSFYAVYRDRIWNGSIGEAEIYGGYGWKLEKEKKWEVDFIEKKEYLSFGIANLKGEELNNKTLLTNYKGSIFYQLEQKFPLFNNKMFDKTIDKSYEYIFEPIKKGVSLNTKISALANFYENDNSQKYIGLGIGPEFVFGNFKEKYFDYSRLSFLPEYKFKSGDSVFKFDQVSDIFTLDIEYDQQLFGPLILKTSGILNIDGGSDNYGDFINSKISLNWKKRSYELGIFYQPHDESGGISFSLFGFE